MGTEILLVVFSLAVLALGLRLVGRLVVTFLKLTLLVGVLVFLYVEVSSLCRGPVTSPPWRVWLSENICR